MPAHTRLAKVYISLPDDEIAFHAFKTPMHFNVDPWVIIAQTPDLYFDASGVFRELHANVYLRKYPRANPGREYINGKGIR